MYGDGDFHHNYHAHAYTDCHCQYDAYYDVVCKSDAYYDLYTVTNGDIYAAYDQHARTGHNKNKYMDANGNQYSIKDDNTNAHSDTTYRTRGIKSNFSVCAVARRYHGRNRYPHGDGYRYTDGDDDADGDGYRYADGNDDVDREQHADRYGYPHGNGYGHANGNPHLSGQ
jgi:hypothetical protein